jgi:hypothetical protein
MKLTARKEEVAKAISSFLLMYENRYTPALWAASYLIWCFEESTIALPSHYAHVSPHVCAELRRSADAGVKSGWNGICRLHQLVNEKGPLDGSSAPYKFGADASLQQP